MFLYLPKHQQQSDAEYESQIYNNYLHKTDIGGSEGFDVSLQRKFNKNEQVYVWSVESDWSPATIGEVFEKGNGAVKNS